MGRSREPLILLEMSLIYSAGRGNAVGRAGRKKKPGPGVKKQSEQSPDPDDRGVLGPSPKRCLPQSPRQTGESARRRGTATTTRKRPRRQTKQNASSHWSRVCVLDMKSKAAAGVLEKIFKTIKPINIQTVLTVRRDEGRADREGEIEVFVL